MNETYKPHKTIMHCCIKLKDSYFLSNINKKNINTFIITMYITF